MNLKNMNSNTIINIIENSLNSDIFNILNIIRSPYNNIITDVVTQGYIFSLKSLPPFPSWFFFCQNFPPFILY